MSQLLELYCTIDDFCQQFNRRPTPEILPSDTTKPRRNRTCSLSISELMTLVILFHQSQYQHFKGFYLSFVAQSLRKEFPTLPSYSRCIELLPRCRQSLLAFLEQVKGESTGIAFVDSTALPVCHNRRISAHQTFANQAKRGRTSVDWFFGFKLHLIINHLGELLWGKLTPGNVDDRQPLREGVPGLQGKLFGDKGYISQPLKADLAEQRIDLVTKTRRNMKPIPRTDFDNHMLRHRTVIESVIHRLKSGFHLQHTRHRSPLNYLIHLLASLVAYSLSPNKPHLTLNKVLAL